MKTIVAGLTGLLVAAGCVMFAGCDVEPAEQASITITPASVTLANGQSVGFTATGWRDYEWSLSNPSLGTLSNTKGDSTVYTSRTTNHVISYIFAESLATIAVSTNRNDTNAVINNLPTHLSGQAELVHQ